MRPAPFWGGALRSWVCAKRASWVSRDPFFLKASRLAQGAVSGRELPSRVSMQIRFFATIRECTGESEIRWDEPAATLGELLRALSARYGPSFRRWVLEDGDLGKAILVVINGHDSRHEGGIHAPLQPDDTIAIFPMIAGGQGQA